MRMRVFLVAIAGILPVLMASTPEAQAPTTVTVTNPATGLEASPNPWGPCFNTERLTVTNNTNAAGSTPGTITVLKTPAGTFKTITPGNSENFDCLNKREVLTITFLPGPPGPSQVIQVPEAGTVNSNNVTLNNGGDVVFLYSSPSSGFTAGANPPDATGDWYYKCFTGAGTLNHVIALGSVMEVDGFYESLFDTFWGTIGSPASSSADFYERTLGPAIPSVLNPGILEPAFATLGFTTETLVIVGNSGFGNPCTVAPSLCSPVGSTCPPTGFVNGYLVELNFSSTPGTGVVLPADGTPLSDTALTYFVNGGMTATGGVCGLGDYGLQDVHSTSETQADLAGGLNIDGGFQLGGGAPLAEAVVSMLEANLTFRDSVVQHVSDTGGAGVEPGDNGGGATNGRRLSVGSGLSTTGIEIRDLELSAVPNVAVAGSSLVPIPNPGVPVFGGQANLLVVPDGVFTATSGAWTGAVTPTVFVFTSEGAFVSPQLPIAPGSAGIILNTQGLIVDLTVFEFTSTNRISQTLAL